MKNNIGTTTGLASLLTLLAFGTASANVLTNPGFENEDAWGVIFSLGDDQGYANGTSHTGTRSYMLSTAEDIINLSQAVAFVPGQDYELSFWVLNYGAGNDFLSVSIFASDAPEMTYLQGDVGTELESWVQVNLNFTVPAVGDYYRFVFKGYDNNASFFIDDVSLTMVPTTGPAGLLGLGGLVAARRRRCSRAH